MRAIPRRALTGCWASWAGSSRQLCRRALDRTGCRGAGLGHRCAPAPSLGEGFSREAGSGGSFFTFQGRVGQNGEAEAGRLGPHPSLAPCARAWLAAGSPPCGHCPRRPQPLPRSPEPGRRSAPTVLTCTQSLGAAGTPGGSLLRVVGREGQGSEGLFLVPENHQVPYPRHIPQAQGAAT